MGTYSQSTLNTMVGKIFTSVKKEWDSVVFTEADGSYYRMEHQQSCCERVDLEDICGELSDLENSPITICYESSNRTDMPKNQGDYSYLWTFYRISSEKGMVVFRWYGTSNGYYSEEVDVTYHEQVNKTVVKKMINGIEYTGTEDWFKDFQEYHPELFS